MVDVYYFDTNRPVDANKSNVDFKYKKVDTLSPNKKYDGGTRYFPCIISNQYRNKKYILQNIGQYYKTRVCIYLGLTFIGILDQLGPT